MKIRNGFVSNSSSSSFCINKNLLTQQQIDQIVDHIDTAVEIENYPSKEHTMDNEGKFGWLDEWKIHVSSDEIKGSTSMDNFNMLEFLLAIGVPSDIIDYD